MTGLLFGIYWLGAACCVALLTVVVVNEGPPEPTTPARTFGAAVTIVGLALLWPLALVVLLILRARD